jgi:hypothetical protein
VAEAKTGNKADTLLRAELVIELQTKAAPFMS